MVHLASRSTSHILKCEEVWSVGCNLAAAHCLGKICIKSRHDQFLQQFPLGGWTDIGMYDLPGIAALGILMMRLIILTDNQFLAIERIAFVRISS